MSVIVWPGDDQDVQFTITSDTDISADTVEVSLGSWTVPPGTWFAPLSTTFSNAGKTCVIVLRVGNGYLLPSPAAVYFPWYRITSSGVVTRMDRQLLRIDVRDATGSPVGTQGPFVETVVAGTGVAVNSADPLHPIVSATGSAAGTVTSVAAGDATITIGGTPTTAPTVKVTPGTFDAAGAASTAQAAATAAAATDATTKANAAQAFAIQRANHTGTQSADTLTDGTTNKAFLATERTKLSGIATAATANSSDATLLARANHTGTESADVLTDGTTNKAFLATERTKLAGIATGATANSADAVLEARANHTGTQLLSTISDAGTAAAANTGTTSGTVPLLSTGGVLPIARLATGTPTGAKFVRDDGTLATPAGGSSGAASPNLFGAGTGAIIRVPQFYTSQTGSFAWGNGVLYLVPYLVTGTTIVTKLGHYLWNVNGSAGAVIRFGIYTDTGAAYPGALVYDALTITASSGINNIVMLTLAAAQTLTPGTYWLAAALQGAPATAPQTIGAVGISGLVDQSNPAVTIVGYSQAAVTGALPANISAGATKLNNGGATVPAILVGA